ncbi:MAG: ANTAR domain-containing protein [Gammaproteobacteria bacterium]|nr:ANTAR domain-containing protein [Gammaproteobacteria bacterium]
MLVSDCIEGDHPVAEAAERAACRVIKQVGPNDEAAHYVERMRPDALVVVSDEMDRAILRELRAVKSINPLPVLVFTRDGRPESIDVAVRAGASSYIVDCSDLDRLKPLLEVATARFREQQRLESELDSTKQALEGRKAVDRAKGILMKQKGMSEDEAYRALRKLAMDRNKKIGEMAEQLIEAADMLM